MREAAMLNNIGVAQMRLEQPDLAKASFHEALDLARVAGNPTNELISLYNLGRTAEALADTTGAIAQYRRALRVLEQLPERTMMRIDIEHRIADLWTH
ncbi:MAG TPA: tetratricopeptide repeat protein [Longimicrobiales bacterium]|nr:tetratricopeptide repeat protein [Longimicrobiales bacterium]